MSSYRMSKPTTGFPVGKSHVITIPAGAVIEKDDFLARVGLTVVFWAGKRLTVSVQDLRENAELVPEIG
jgi:hypothetical protein